MTAAPALAFLPIETPSTVALKYLRGVSELSYKSISAPKPATLTAALSEALGA